MMNEKIAPNDRNDAPDTTAATEDVTGLFTWANLEGSKYRDYSASREKSRAEARHRSEIERAKPDEGPAPEIAATAKDGDRERASPSKPLPIPSAPVRKLATMSSERSRSGPGPRSLPPSRKPQRSPAQGGASRWVALKSNFDQENDWRADGVGPGTALGIPALALVSLAGGVGKTSMVASMGCLLAAEGVSSLLVDTHVYGLLPLFFGARELPPGTARTFVSGAGSAPIRVMTLDTKAAEDEEAGESSVFDQISQHVDGMNRVLIDVSTGSVELIRQVLRLAPTVLVVLTPDMSSVVSLQALHAVFEQLEEESGRPTELFFVLNQFDTSLRLHMSVRERLMRQLGKLLLPFVIRRSGAVSEALAEGMTMVDYAPDSQVVEDLSNLGQWIRELDESAVSEAPSVRWRER
jgi:cellulose synthase operon protein YhjQ